MEILTYSVEQLKRQTDQIEKWDDKATVTLVFYDGVQFTDRRSKNVEQSPFKDAQLVYEGIVDGAKISYEEKPMHDVYAEASDILEDRNYVPDEDDDKEKTEDHGHYPDSGMDYHDTTVSRLEGYYSRNNIKSNLDDDDED